jgi:hypothetical protein
MQLHQEMRAHSEVEGLGQVGDFQPRRDAADACDVDLQDGCGALLHVGRELARRVERLTHGDRHLARRR